MKIYTKTGDRGTTSLVGGTRVAKDDPRIEAYGTVDELAASIGYLHDLWDGQRERAQMVEILGDLMVCQALLAAEDQTIAKLPTLESSDVEKLEHWTDELMKDLPQMRYFTLPVGERVLSYSHVCRTVCRRAERRIVTARREYDNLPESVATYINRLSDYLYGFGRFVAFTKQVDEVAWKPRE